MQQSRRTIICHDRYVCADKGFSRAHTQSLMVQSEDAVTHWPDTPFQHTCHTQRERREGREREREVGGGGGGGNEGGNEGGREGGREGGSMYTNVCVSIELV